LNEILHPFPADSARNHSIDGVFTQPGSKAEDALRVVSADDGCVTQPPQIGSLLVQAVDLRAHPGEQRLGRDPVRTLSDLVGERIASSLKGRKAADVVPTREIFADRSHLDERIQQPKE
jgi:hypothetical protein